jgi:DNA-binding NarL/FixJ family response regulator
MDSEKDSTSAKQATAVSGYPSTAAKKRPRIVIADDDPRVLAEIGNFLGTDFDVVGHASNGRELLETVKRLNPALVVADLAMPEMDGIEAAREITRTFCNVKVVILSGYSDGALAEAAFDAGASSYVVKVRACVELIPAIQCVLDSHN